MPERFDDLRSGDSRLNRERLWKPRLAGIATSETFGDLGGTRVPELRPGLYVHVPFCSAICPYCDFAVVKSRPADHSGFVEALAREARFWGAGVEDDAEAFDTVYLGGGTPSALRDQQLAELVSELRSALPIAPTAEWSLEINPEDVTPGALAQWRALGFDVASLGIQALDDVVLRDLGRRHGVAEARRAIELTLEAGFSRVNVDLIYATGKRTLGAWERELSEIASFGVHHLSCYELTFHDGTPFERQRIAGRREMLPEDERARWFLTTHKALEKLGLQGYEVSNFARSPQDQARHNRKYWEHQPYLGLGPSAHSFDGRSRWWNRRALGAWRAALDEESRPAESGRGTWTDSPSSVRSCEGNGQINRQPWPWVEERETLDADALLLEAVHLGLRTRRGIDLDALRRRYRIDLMVESAAAIQRAVSAGRVRVESDESGDRLVPTLRGWLVSDALTLELTESLHNEEARVPWE